MKKRFIIIILLLTVFATATNSRAWTSSKEKSTGERIVKGLAGGALIYYGMVFAKEGFETEIKEWDHLLSEFWYNHSNGQSYYKWHGCDDYDTHDYLWSKSWTEGNIYYDYTYCHHKRDEYKNCLKGVGGIGMIILGGWFFIDALNEPLKSTGFQLKMEQENLQTVKILAYKKWG